MPQTKKNIATKKTKAKNVILLIGDGMGLTQISAGMYSQSNKTALENCAVIGLHKPYASNKLVTDSAAAATSFASGVKTYNGAIGVDKDTIAAKTLLEEAIENKKATGLIATSTIVHATPAAFFSHEKYRKNYENIATQLVESGVDFFVGGGKAYFDRRDDEVNLINAFREKGYDIYNFLDSDMNEIIPDATKKFGFLTSDKDPLPYAQGRDYLMSATKKSIEYLSKRSDNGFFLMIEGSQIDWGGHANDGQYVISEFQEYDKVIAYVLNWAAKNGETLVIVTADHETGGMAIQPDSKMDSISFAFTSGYHTGTMIPVFADGVNAQEFSGIYENTAIYDKIRAAFGWTRTIDQ